ncbi:MAG: RHS repeat domain-containing protein [Tenacibaculum sp.]
MSKYSTNIVALVYNGNGFTWHDTIDLSGVVIEKINKKNDHLWVRTRETGGEKNHYFISYQLDGTFLFEAYDEDIPYIDSAYSNISDGVPTHYVSFSQERDINLSEITLNNILFSSVSNNSIRNRYDLKTYFFNGNNWSDGIYGHLFGGKNRIQIGITGYTSQYWSFPLNTGRVSFYDANFNSFTSEQVYVQDFHSANYQRIIGDYLVDKKEIYRFNSNNQEFIEEYNSSEPNIDFFNDPKNRSKLIIADKEQTVDKSWYFYIDKRNGSLKKKQFNRSPRVEGQYGIYGDYIVENYSPSYESKNTKFHHLINGDFGQDVHDLVLKSIDIYDGINQNSITEFNYDNYKTLSDGTTYYGEVITEKKGNGSTSLGKTFDYYNIGNDDIRKLGLLERTVIKNTEGNTVQESIIEMNTGPNLFINNSDAKPVFIGNRLLQNKKINHSYFYENSQQNIFTSQEEYDYNENGLISKTKKINSKGLLEEQVIEYAYENSNTFENKNMLTAISKRISKINNEVVGVSLAQWTNENGKLYLNKDFNGPTENDLRLTSEITRISNKGVVEETTNGKGLYAVNLSGYNYKRSVASIDNAQFSEVINNLDVTYSQLQNLNNSQLRVELMKLYNRLPNSMIKLSFYDGNGNIISEIDAREEKIKYHYDNFNRLEYVTDSNNKVLKKYMYNYAKE